MDITKEIKFNTESLLKNTSVSLSYNGFLVDDAAETIHIKYCFNDDWDNCIQEEMDKSEDGYTIDLNLESNDSISICFTDNLDRWDNNNFNNYVFQIKEKNTELVVAQNSLPYLQQNKLRKTYIWRKKIKLLLYKLFSSLPRFITGNYRRRLNL